MYIIQSKQKAKNGVSRFYFHPEIASEFELNPIFCNVEEYQHSMSVPPCLRTWHRLPVVHPVRSAAIEIRPVAPSWRLHLGIASRIAVLVVHAKQEWVQRGKRRSAELHHALDAIQNGC